MSKVDSFLTEDLIGELKRKLLGCSLFRLQDDGVRLSILESAGLSALSDVERTGNGTLFLNRLYPSLADRDVPSAGPYRKLALIHLLEHVLNTEVNSLANPDEYLAFFSDVIRRYQEWNDEGRPPVASGRSPSLVAIPASPYPGPQPYGAHYARFFYGRDGEVRHVMDQIRQKPFLVLMGASGTGKSSLLFGGVKPRLERDSLHEWKWIEVLPGRYPITALERRLNGAQARPDEAVAEHLAEDPPGARLLLVVDQFEECFTVSEEEERRAFLTTLNLLRKVPHCAIIVSLRSDFYPDLITSSLWPIEPADQYVITPLSGDALRAAIEEPAKATGVRMEPRLLERLLADADDEPGRLSLLQATLNRLWDQMETPQLKLAAYQAMCSQMVRGNCLAAALAEQADRTLDRLTREQYAIAPRIFLRLIQFVEGRPDTRRRQPLAALVIPGEDTLLFEQALSTLADSGLVSVGDSNDPPGTKIVDLSHEALVEGWPTLRGWLRKWRTAEQTRRRWETQADEWAQRGRGQSGLLDQGELQDVDDWLGSPASAQLGVSETLRALVEASRLGIAEAEAVRQRKRAAEIAARSQAQLERDPELALLLARESVLATWQHGWTPVVQAEDALRQALAQMPIRLVIDRGAETPCVTRFAPDGKRFVVAAQDGTVRSFEAESGAEVGVLARAGSALQDLCFSPDGSLLAGAAADGSVRFWTVDTGAAQPSLAAHRGPVRSVAYNPEGNRLLTAGKDGAVKVWTLGRLRRATTLSGHRGPVFRAAFDPNGEKAVSVGEDATVRVWQVQTKKATVLPGSHVNAVLDAAYSPDGYRIVTAGQDRTVRIWGAYYYQELIVLRGHTGAVNRAVFSPDNRYVLTASDDGTARIWHTESGSLQVVLRGHVGPVIDAAYSPDGLAVLTTGADHTLRVWDASPGVFPVSGYELCSIAISPDGKHVVTGAIGYGSVNRTNEGTIYDVATGRRGETLYGHSDGVQAAVYSPNGGRILTASLDGTAGIWDAATGRSLGFLRHTKGDAPEERGRPGDLVALHSAAFHPDGRHAVTGGSKGVISIWDVEAKQRVRTIHWHTGNVTSVGYDPDGKRILSAGGDQQVLIWDAETGTPLASLPGQNGMVVAAVWSPDGRQVVTASVEGVACIWDAATGHLLRTLRADNAALTSVAYSPREAAIVTGSADGNVRMWDAAHGQERSILRGHVGEVVGVTFSPDGERVISAGRDKTVRQWPASIDGLLAIAARRVRRELTATERALYLGEGAAGGRSDAADDQGQVAAESGQG